MKAIDALAVLIDHERPSRSYSKTEMKRDLSNPEIYISFLKLCLESDFSPHQPKFKKGLFFIIQAIGISKVGKGTGINRVTLYRMFTEDGNPEFKNLLKILQFLGMKLWVVDEHFAWRGEKSGRYKNYQTPQMITKKTYGRHVGSSRPDY